MGCLPWFDLEASLLSTKPESVSLAGASAPTTAFLHMTVYIRVLVSFVRVPSMLIVSQIEITSNFNIPSVFAKPSNICVFLLQSLHPLLHREELPPAQVSWLAFSPAIECELTHTYILLPRGRAEDYNYTGVESQR